MNVLIPYEALAFALDAWLGGGSFVLQFHLFKNDVTPDMDTERTDFVEADYSTYAPVSPVTPLSFVNQSEQGGEVSPIVFGFSSPGGSDTQTLYGWYCDFEYDVARHLVACQRFDTPIAPPYGTALAFALTMFARQKDQPPASHFEVTLPGGVEGDPSFSEAFSITVQAVDLNGFPIPSYSGLVTLTNAGGSLGNATLGTQFSGPPPDTITVTDGIGFSEDFSYGVPGGSPLQTDTITCTDGTISGSDTLTVHG